MLFMLSKEEQLDRLDTALDEAIEILQLECGYICPADKDGCWYPSRFGNCQPEDDGYECWRDYLCRPHD